MTTEILMPKLGFSMNEGKISEWFVDNGGAVVEGAPLFALEADKSTVEVEAPCSGSLRITSEVGETYAVGSVLGYIE